MPRGLLTKPRYLVRGLFYTEEGGCECREWEGVPSIAGIMLLHPELEALGPHAIQRIVHRRIDGVLKTKKVKQCRYYIEKLE